MAIKPYAINGSVASMAPVSVHWQPIPLGVDHNGATLFSANWNVVHQFDSASIGDAQQWLSQASANTSVNLTTMDRWLLESTILSNVYLDLTQAPVLTDVHTGPFTITVRGATASALEVSGN